MTTTAIAKPASKSSDLMAPVGTPMALQSYLNSEGFKARMAEVLPRHLNADRMLRVALVAMSQAPDLFKCTLDSVLKSLMVAAQLGLDPSGGLLGEAYLVPFNRKVKIAGAGESWRKECQLIPGYRGLIALARRSGQVRDVSAAVVYKGDVFEFERGLQPKLRHIPDYAVEQVDKDIVGAYAIFYLKSGHAHAEFVPRWQIEKIRKRSKAGDDGEGNPIGIWRDWYPAMCIKTAVRQAYKLVPISSEDFAQALALDNDDAPEVLMASTSPGARPKTLSERIAAQPALPEHPLPVDVPKEIPAADVATRAQEDGLIQRPKPETPPQRLPSGGQGSGVAAPVLDVGGSGQADPDAEEALAISLGEASTRDEVMQVFWSAAKISHPDIPLAAVVEVIGKAAALLGKRNKEHLLSGENKKRFLREILDGKFDFASVATH